MTGDYGSRKSHKSGSIMYMLCCHTTCPAGYNNNGFMATAALGQTHICSSVAIKPLHYIKPLH